MNPHTGDVTPLDLDRLVDEPFEERERAAREVGLDDPDDLVLVEGTEENVRAVSEAVKAQAAAKAKRRAANKRARQSRRNNR